VLCGIQLCFKARSLNRPVAGPKSAPTAPTPSPTTCSMKCRRGDHAEHHTPTFPRIIVESRGSSPNCLPHSPLLPKSCRSLCATLPAFLAPMRRWLRVIAAACRRRDWLGHHGLSLGHLQPLADVCEAPSAPLPLPRRRQAPRRRNCELLVTSSALFA
jgi:hypothetical protein